MLENLFTSTLNSWVTPVAFTLIAWAVLTGVLSRRYSVPDMILKLTEILLLAATVALALVMWIAWWGLQR